MFKKTEPFFARSISCVFWWVLSSLFLPVSFAVDDSHGFIWQNKYKPYFEVGGAKYFNQSSKFAGVYDAFIPLLQNDDILLFTDARIFDRSGSSFEGNVHLGYRKLYSGTNQMFGAYGAFDRRRSANANNFNQLTFGFEYWQDKWFVGGNIYKPIGTTKWLLGEIKASEYEFVGRNISELKISKTTTINKYYEKAMPGIDAEIGCAITDSLTGYVGGYYFASSDATTIAGPKLRLTYDYQKFKGRVLGILDGISIEAGVQHDKPRGNTAYLGIRLKVGLISPETSVNLSGFERHMVELIRRDPDVVTNNAQEMHVERKTYTAEDAMKDVMEAIQGSNNNIKKNKDIYLEGLEAARKAQKQQEEIVTAFEQNSDMQDLFRQTKELMCDLNGDCAINDGLTPEQQQKIHDTAVALLSLNKNYDAMKCNQAVAWVYQNAGLIFHEETVAEFPGRVNTIHFRKLLSSPIELRTGDIGVWKRGVPGKSGWVHHMLIYDKDAWGVDGNNNLNNAWSTHSHTHNRYFNGTRYEIFSKSFKFNPDWYRYR